jgi:hypothetical protein
MILISLGSYERTESIKKKDSKIDWADARVLEPLEINLKHACSQKLLIRTVAGHRNKVHSPTAGTVQQTQGCDTDVTRRVTKRWPMPSLVTCKYVTEFDFLWNSNPCRQR